VERAAPRRAEPAPASGRAASPVRSRRAAKPEAPPEPLTAQAARPRPGELPGAPARPSPAKPASARRAARPADAAPPRLAAAAAPRLAAAAASPAVTKAATAAGPRPRAARTPRRIKLEPDRLERLVAAAVKSLEDDKAEDVVVLDVTGRASFTDRMILATGLADRQIQAMASHLDDAFGKEGLKLRRDSVQASDEWVLIDAGDIVVHLFRAEKRAELSLERMWGPDSPLGEAGPGEKNPI